MADKKIVKEKLQKVGMKLMFTPIYVPGNIADVLADDEDILAACLSPNQALVHVITGKRLIALQRSQLVYDCVHADVAKVEIDNSSDSLRITDTNGGVQVVILGKPVEARKNYIAVIERGLHSKTERVAGRGKLLARAMLGYAGGFDQTHTINAGALSLEGTLLCYENQVEYHKRNNDFIISGDQIAHVEIGGHEQISSRISITRMATLGVFALAAPKRTSKKEAFALFELVDGRRVLFQTTTKNQFDLQRSLANAVSFYNSRQVANTQAQAPSANANDLDQLEKLAALKERGLITEDEFQAKKRQLLGL